MSVQPPTESAQQGGGPVRHRPATVGVWRHHPPRLGSDKNYRARSRFDAAHELGHLVVHGDSYGVKQVEQQAHMLAAGFLMPAHDIGARAADIRRLADAVRAQTRMAGVAGVAVDASAGAGPDE